MYISYNKNDQNINFNIAKNKINFKSNKWLAPKAYRIENDLFQKCGIDSDFKNNSYMAECVEKTVNIFKDNFGHWALPSKINAETINEYGVYAYYSNWNDSVVVDNNNKCFENEKNLITEMKQHRNLFFLPDWFSTIHPLHIFVHEMAHSAHYHNLESHGNGSSMNYLRETKIPTAIGRLIAKFKLSKYAATNMNEFMAERITKDILKNLTPYGYYRGNSKDLDYSNIFCNKWNYRYSTPQAYIDYYTQQVWNGDIVEAKRAGDKIEHYLQSLEAEETPVVIKNAKILTEGIPGLEILTGGLFNMFKSATKTLDKKNDLRLGNKLKSEE